MRTFLFSILFFFFNFNAFCQNISCRVEIENLKNTDGSVIIKVFYNAKAYDDNTPNIIKCVPKKGNMKNGIFITQLSLPPGTYGIAFVDDENNNKKMDYNLLGIPKEGFGFSDFYLSRLSKPEFSDFSFQLTKNTSSMKIRLKYL